MLAIDATMDGDHVNSQDVDLSAIVFYNADSTDDLFPNSGHTSQCPSGSSTSQSGRKSKKRALRACTNCNTRKVRCDVVAHGMPCANCTYFGGECVVLKRRMRKPRAKATKPAFAQVNEAETSDAINSDAMIDVGEDQNAAKEARAPSSSHSPPSSGSEAELESPAPQHHPMTSLASSSSLVTFTTFPADLDPSDLAYLGDHDALTIPDASLQAKLLKAYDDFVHGQIPILDMDTFLSVTRSSNTSRSDITDSETANKPKAMSLLLYQAILYAGLSYVGISVLRTAGYSSRDHAQRVFSERVRLLYARNTCTDRLSIIQSLLLMTVCSSSPVGKNANAPCQKEIETALHWLGLAISNSYMLELNRNDASMAVPLKRRRLQRRIWWTAFLRDRTLALMSTSAGSSQRPARPFRIKREDCTVDLLTLDDFDLGAYAEYDGIDELQLKMRMDAGLFVERVMLCWCSSDGLVAAVLGLPAPEADVEGDAYTREKSPLAMSDCPSEIFVPNAQSLINPGDISRPSVDVDGEYKDFMEYFTVGLAQQEQESVWGKGQLGQGQAAWQQSQVLVMGGMSPYILAGF